MFIRQQAGPQQAGGMDDLKEIRMPATVRTTGPLAMLAALAIPASLAAQPADQPPAGADPATLSATYGATAPEAALTAGPQIDGIISARSGDRVQITATDGTNTVVTVTQATRIKGRSGLFGLNNKTQRDTALLNGLPVSVKTLQSGNGLIASQIQFKSNDLKTAAMIRSGTDQRFAEQTAATEALRGRMADIDQYNIKATTDVNFDTGKTALSPDAKVALCNTAMQAEQMKNALLLVVGYTDSVGSDEYNQVLSERRAGAVVNYLQQACHWKPYRMLTPTGMAKADPLASNDTPEGKARNRRVSVNVLVSKGLDGL
jgi:outer membrane protein OmpA-like peptidoglycan-associated protein